MMFVPQLNGAQKKGKGKKRATGALREQLLPDVSVPTYR